MLLLFAAALHLRRGHGCRVLLALIAVTFLRVGCLLGRFCKFRSTVMAVFVDNYCLFGRMANGKLLVTGQVSAKVVR